MKPFESADELYGHVINSVLNDGKRVEPRGHACLEKLGVTLRLANPSQNVITSRRRKLSYHFMVAEWAWITAGLDDVASIAPYNKRISEFSDDEWTFFGAYGPRIYRDMSGVLGLLKRDPDTRQAVVCTWRPEVYQFTTKDVPCTLTLQFFIRRGALDLHVNMRSNDVWLGLPYDLFTMTQIQRSIALALGVDVGEYVHHVGSLHIYEHDLDNAERYTSDDPADVLAVSREPSPPPPPWGKRLLGLGLVKFCRDWMSGVSVAPSPDNEYACVLAHRFDKTTVLGPYFARVIP